MGKFHQLSPELWPLIEVSILYLEQFMTDFLQTLYKS